MNILPKFRRQRAGYIFLAFTILWLFIFSYCEAFEVVQIEPAKIRLIISPGNAQTGTINILNNSKEAKSVRVYLEDWIYLPACDGTKDFKPAGTADLSAAKWISFLPSEFTIPAYGRKTLNYTVKVPAQSKKRMRIKLY